LTPEYANYATALSPYLDRDEHLLWVGRPRQRILLRPSDAAMIPFSLMWGGFAFFWEYMVVTGGGRGRGHAPWFFMLWGIPFCLIGIYMIAGRFFADAWMRSRMWYGVTNRRALIVSGIASSRLASFELATVGEITLTKSFFTGSGSIQFGSINTDRPYGRRTPKSFGGTNTNTFDQIDNVDEVYRVLREVQQQAKESAAQMPPGARPMR
jgi:hypothetical protein